MHESLCVWCSALYPFRALIGMSIDQAFLLDPRSTRELSRLTTDTNDKNALNGEVQSSFTSRVQSDYGQAQFLQKPVLKLSEIALVTKALASGRPSSVLLFKS